MGLASWITQYCPIREKANWTSRSRTVSKSSGKYTYDYEREKQKMFRAAKWKRNFGSADVVLPETLCKCSVISELRRRIQGVCFFFCLEQPSRLITEILNS